MLNSIVVVGPYRQPVEVALYMHVVSTAGLMQEYCSSMTATISEILERTLTVS